MPEGLYPGDYLVPIGAALAAEYGDRYVAAPEAEWLVLFREKTVAAMMELIRADLALLGIHHDVFSSEAEVQASGKVKAAFERLRADGLVYEGVLEAAQGRTARRLGAGRDDLVPRHRLRRRQRPAGDEVGRQPGPISAPISPITRRRRRARTN